MLDELLRAGDKVVLVLKDAEGYQPAPDGTLLTVLGFADKYEGYGNHFGYEPGVYENRLWVRVRADESGKEWSELYSRLAAQDPKALEGREPISALGSGRKIRELPETPFVDGDKITSPALNERQFPGKVAYILWVEYRNIGVKCADGVTPMPVYQLTGKPDAGWSTWTRAEETYQLVERGRPWKFWHKEPIVFESTEDEGRFMHRMGQCEYVKNPKYNLYKWDKNEAVEAIYTDLGDIIAVANGLFGSGPATEVLRYKDRNLGERMRQLTMQGFPREAITA